MKKIRSIDVKKLFGGSIERILVDCLFPLGFLVAGIDPQRYTVFAVFATLLFFVVVIIFPGDLKTALAVLTLFSIGFFAWKFDFPPSVILLHFINVFLVRMNPFFLKNI